MRVQPFERFFDRLAFSAGLFHEQATDLAHVLKSKSFNRLNNHC